MKIRITNIFLKAFSLNIFLVPIVVISVSAYHWPIATLFWVLAIAFWIGVIAVCLKMQKRIDDDQAMIIRQAEKATDASSEVQEVTEEYEDIDSFEEVSWNFSYIPEVDRPIVFSDQTEFTFVKGESYPVKVRVYQDKLSKIGAWVDQNSEGCPLSSAEGLQVEVAFQTPTGEIQTQGWVRCWNFFFRDQFEMESTSDLDWSGAPSVYRLMDSREMLVGIFDGEPTEYKIKYTSAECLFQIVDGLLQVKCEFYDSVNIQDIETAYYHVPIERILFPFTPKVYYADDSKNEIDDIDPEAGGQVFRRIS